MSDIELRKEIDRLRVELREERDRRREVEDKLLALCDPTTISALRIAARRSAPPADNPSKPRVQEVKDGKLVDVDTRPSTGLRELGILV